MKADTLGQPSEPALEHCSGTIPTRKSSAHSGIHPPKSDRAPQNAVDDTTRAYNPLEVAELLSAAQEATKSRFEAESNARDATNSSQPDSASEATRAYSPEEFANLLSKTPAPTPPTPSLTDLESPIHAPKQDFWVQPPLDPTIRERAAAEHQGTLGPLRLEPVTETPTHAQRLDLAAPLSEVVDAAPPEPKQRRRRYRLLALTLTCLVGAACWLVLEQPQEVSMSWWRTSANAGQKNVPVNEMPRLVRLHIEIDPPDAALFLDGEPASNPLRIAYPSNNAMHEIRGEAPGYVSRAASIRFDRDVVVVLSLPSALP